MCSSGPENHKSLRWISTGYPPDLLRFVANERRDPVEIRPRRHGYTQGRTQDFRRNGYAPFPLFILLTQTDNILLTRIRKCGSKKLGVITLHQLRGEVREDIGYRDDIKPYPCLRIYELSYEHSCWLVGWSVSVVLSVLILWKDREVHFHAPIWLLTSCFHHLQYHQHGWHDKLCVLLWSRIRI